MSEIKIKIKLLVKKFEQGKKIEAIENLNDLLKIYQNNIDLLYLKASMQLDIGEIKKSLEIFNEIYKTNPKNIKILDSIYSQLLINKQYDYSQLYLDKLLELDYKNFKPLRDKAFLLYLRKNFLESKVFIKKSLSINNSDPFSLNIYGLIKIEEEKFKDALMIFKKAIDSDSNYADSYNNAGRCYIMLEDLNLAFYNFKKAYRKNSKSDLAIQNIANVLSLKDKNKLAIKFYEKAKKINLQNKSLDENIAICQIKLKNLKWIENYLHKKNLANINQDIVLGYSYLLLANKEFKKGFKDFDSRFNTKNFPIKNKYHNNLINIVNKKLPLNESEKILIVKEQGVGDEVLFSSMYIDLLKMYKNVKIECDPRLIDIFKRSFNKNVFFPFGHFSSSLESIKEFKNILYSGSLTRFFRKYESDFISFPYLKIFEQKNIEIAKKIEKFRDSKIVGLSWKSIVNIYGKLKSLSLKDFEKIITKDRNIINLQYGDVEQEIRDFKNNGLIVNSFKEIDLFNDFESLMCLLNNLDVFVTVSNSTAHFAGSLGIPTILICPKKSSTYYYWDYDDGKTPWYKSIQIVKFDRSINHTMDKVNKLIDSI
tara:strand:- start:3962 stop:5746 length:1785 start_codon:yes stop_codon:yes gene_type:complete